MKKIVALLLIGLSLNCSWGQTDTLLQGDINFHIANRVYGNLRQNITNGFLMNRIVGDSTQMISFLLNDYRDSLVNADTFFGFLYELRLMAMDSSQIPDLYSLYIDVSTFIAEIEFEEEIYVYPLGIADYKLDLLNEIDAINNGAVIFNDSTFVDGLDDPSVFSTRTVQLVSTLFDLHGSESMGFVFKTDHFFSNYRSVDDVESIELFYKNDTLSFKFDEIQYLDISDSLNIVFSVRIKYKEIEETIDNNIIIETGDMLLRSTGKQWKEENCFHVGWFGNEQGHKLRFCYIRGCGNNNAGYRPRKPYILVTGYRPPLMEQSYKKTWQFYNSEHNHLLEHLHNNGYDVFLVKFNIDATPFTHGMIESADLFIDFLNDLNSKKDGRHENVIHASSMGADIARLALLKMEKLHFENNTYSNHHSRLYIAYDANFFGANLPLAYQYQIYSGYHHPAVLGPVGGHFLRVFLYSTLQQKTVKELLMYHALANNEFSPTWNYSHGDLIPTHHYLRQNYYNALNNVESQHIKPSFIFPLQKGTRNVAISLGKLSGTNDEIQGYNFKEAGFYWRNIGTVPYKSKLRAAIYFDDSYAQLFHRFRLLPSSSFFGFPLIFPSGLALNHKVSVKNMQHVDNAPGSFLGGMGNIIAVTDYTYFPAQWAILQIGNIFGGDYRKFTHKSTFTALGINPNLWPSDGTHTLNLQTQGLMYSGKTASGQLILSNYYGYPNLGRPTDHFQVTPFEAIFCSNEIQPHIRLNVASPAYRAALTGFILDEVEPWYLGLQNQRLGSQARTNYTYKAERRAKHHIVIGHLVTPTTDPGDYIVQPNADLNLRAGNLIHIKPGTHFMAGSKVHAKIEYFPCHIDIPPPPPIIIDDPWGDDGGTLEPLPIEDENNCVLSQEFETTDHSNKQTDWEEFICTMPRNDEPAESNIDLKLVAIKENKFEFKALVL